MPGYVILGATGGVGSVLCERLAASGAQLVLGGRDGQRLEQLAQRTGSHPFTLDATVPTQVEACAQAAVERYGRLDGIVNCVGSLLLKPAHPTSDDEWAATIAANLTSAFAAVRAGARAMMRTGGSIVLVSSAAARIGLPKPRGDRRREERRDRPDAGCRRILRATWHPRELCRSRLGAHAADGASYRQRGIAEGIAGHARARAHRRARRSGRRTGVAARPRARVGDRTGARRRRWAR